MFVIHLINTCSVFEYLNRISVDSYEIDTKTKGNAIIISHNDSRTIIPLANIAAIEVE
jgi:hypothetical protein